MAALGARPPPMFMNELRLQQPTVTFPVMFLQGGQTLMAHSANRGKWKMESVFWDIQSGRETLRIRDARAFDVSPGGDLAVGQSGDPRGLWPRGEMSGAVWRTSSGERSSAPSSEGGPRRNCVGAAFAPGGSDVAAVVSDDGWAVEVWDAASGLVRCS
eukprot:CAMPEP_0170215004 /NCGR_PEP_ID=MMETSP0116_2-20130129/7135_1 /TAXON_ID=400756 /ORGANISM="Durinskia baltica, Strain CSIRO CS-38" /LENGTH=157 /DNA_ID=CAMNT_0010465573 /DNA_START=95 /DNA_END=565 /DNA_ORIENTATION=+